MHAFQDNADRTWEIAINVATIRKLRRSVLKIDLMKVVSDGAKGLGELLGDPIQLVDMLYVLCQTQAEAQGISDEDFGRAMAGDAIQLASDGFLNSLVDFFPEAKARENLRTLLAKAKEVGSLVLTQMENQVKRLEPATIAERLMSSLTSAQESSESIPVLSPSASSAA